MFERSDIVTGATIGVGCIFTLGYLTLAASINGYAWGPDIITAVDDSYTIDSNASNVPLFVLTNDRTENCIDNVTEALVNCAGNFVPFNLRPSGGLVEAVRVDNVSPDAQSITTTAGGTVTIATYDPLSDSPFGYEYNSSTGRRFAMFSTVLYTPPSNTYNGVDSFEYKLCGTDPRYFRSPDVTVPDCSFMAAGNESNHSLYATVNLTVNPIGGTPTATGYQYIMAVEDETYNFKYNDLNNAYSDDNPLHSIRIDSLPALGTLELDGAPVAVNDIIPAHDLPSLSFTPTPNTFTSPGQGNTSANNFSVSYSDGVNFSPSSNVALEIIGKNDAPVVADINVNLNIDQSYDFSVDSPTLFEQNFSDIDVDKGDGGYFDFATNSNIDEYYGGDFAGIRIETIPTNGFLEYDDGGLAFTVSGGETIDVGDLQYLTYVPSTGYNGPDSFTWTAYDDILVDGSGFPEPFDPNVQTPSNVSTVSFQVGPLNQPPTSSDFTKTGSVNSIITFSAQDFIDNYNDLESDPLVTVTIDTLPVSGQLVLNSGGSLTAISAGQTLTPGELDTLEFIPATDTFGDVSFDYTVNDGTNNSASSSTITVEILEQSDPNPDPTSNPDTDTIGLIRTGANQSRTALFAGLFTAFVGIMFHLNKDKFKMKSKK